MLAMTAFIGGKDDQRLVCLQASRAITLHDDKHQKLEGYTTLDMVGSQNSDFGTFSGCKTY